MISKPCVLQEVCKRACGKMQAQNGMITSRFDLSLYTCTPGGSNRVTVRCNAAQDSNR